MELHPAYLLSALTLASLAPVSVAAYYNASTGRCLSRDPIKNLLPLLLLTLSATLLAAPSAQAYYDPNTGRWLSRDPIHERGGLNLYLIAQNNCLTHVDSDGRWVIRTMEDLESLYEHAKEIYKETSKMVERLENCKPWCGGISSPVSFYCQCIQRYYRDVDNLAECICVQFTDDKECKSKVKASVGIPIPIADDFLTTKEQIEKAEEVMKRIEEIKEKIEKLRRPRTCCPTTK